MTQHAALAPWLAGGMRLLWVAAWVELILGRVLSRVGVYIPKTPPMLAGYRLLSDLGQIAFNLALLAAVGVLALGVWSLWAEARAGSRLSAFLIGGAALLVLLPLAGGHGAVLSLVTAVAVPLAAASLLLPVLLAPAASASGAARGPARHLERSGLLLVLAAHLAWYATAAIQLLLTNLNRPGTWAPAAAVLHAGELAALLAPLALAAACLVKPGGAAAVGVVAPGWSGAGQPAHSAASGMQAGGQTQLRWLAEAVRLTLGAWAFAIAYLVNADIAGVLAIWSLGFTLSWPAALYGLALVAAAWLVHRSLAAGGVRVWRGYGLGLIFLAGFGLQVNLQHLLLLTGYLALRSRD